MAVYIRCPAGAGQEALRQLAGELNRALAELELRLQALENKEA